MTKQEQKQIIRVCGEEYEETDIPSYIRNREKAEEKELAIEYLIHERDCEEVLERWAELHGAVQGESGEWEV